MLSAKNPSPSSGAKPRCLAFSSRKARGKWDKLVSLGPIQHDLAKDIKKSHPVGWLLGNQNLLSALNFKIPGTLEIVFLVIILIEISSILIISCELFIG